MKPLAYTLWLSWFVGGAGMITWFVYQSLSGLGAVIQAIGG
jgi:hypothetical protein